jgi:hypothetical protein
VATRQEPGKPPAGKRRAPIKQPKGKTDPPGAPLEATLKVNKSVYKLDLGGKTAEEFRKQVEATRLIAEDPEELRDSPAPPAVDLTLTVRNTSNKDVELRISGDAVKVTLELKGPGALNKALDRAFPLNLRLGRVMKLGPGKSHSFPITSLASGFRSLEEGVPGASHLAYWTAPGKYTLTVSLRSEMIPLPKGARKGYEKFGVVTLTPPGDAHGEEVARTSGPVFLREEEEPRITRITRMKRKRRGLNIPLCSFPCDLLVFLLHPCHPCNPWFPLLPGRRYLPVLMSNGNVDFATRASFQAGKERVTLALPLPASSGTRTGTR